MTLHVFFFPVTEPGKTDPLRTHHDHNKSSNVIVLTVTAISVPSFVLLSVIVCGVMLIASKLRLSKHETSAEEFEGPASPSNTPVIPAPVYYESVFPMEFQEQDLELKENVAYGPLPNIHRGYQDKMP